MAAAGDRVVSLPCGPGLAASLSYYRAGGDHAPHAHDFTQVSLILSGGLLEVSPRGEHEADASFLGIKPAGLRHANRWGREGALIFSIKLINHPLERLLEAEAGWGRARAPANALVRACLEGDLTEREDAAYDLLAIRFAGAPPCIPPAWLLRARDEIRESREPPRMDDLARAAGVHRVHFSRLFHRCFGVAPSVYRRQVMTARAIAGALGSETSMTGISHAAGFSDQAHMTRSVRADTGLTPSALRALFDQATFVQGGAALAA